MAQTVIIPAHKDEGVLFTKFPVSRFVADHCKFSWTARFYDYQNHNHHHLPFTLHYNILSHNLECVIMELVDSYSALKL